MPLDPTLSPWGPLGTLWGPLGDTFGDPEDILITRGTISRSSGGLRTPKIPPGDTFGATWCHLSAVLSLWGPSGTLGGHFGDIFGSFPHPRGGGRAARGHGAAAAPAPWPPGPAGWWPCARRSPGPPRTGREKFGGLGGDPQNFLGGIFRGKILKKFGGKKSEETGSK